MPLKGRIQVELLARNPPVTDRKSREVFETLEQPLCLYASMRFHIAYDDVSSTCLLRPRGLQHGKCLANARGGAEKDTEAAPFRASLLRLDMCQQLVRVGPDLGHPNARGTEFI